MEPCVGSAKAVLEHYNRSAPMIMLMPLPSLAR
jgi:hypothetical protein